MNGDGITMMMLGPRAVGKTTMLSLMYKGLVGGDLKSTFDFSAARSTAIDLDVAYQKLTEILNQETFKPIGPLLEGNLGVTKHKFTVSFQGKKRFDFNFCDFAGGLILAKDDTPGVKEFLDQLQRAIVIVNVLDGAALVEGSRLYSDKINRPFLISELLKQAFDDEQEHLVLFVITKCEAWLKDNGGREALQKAFETYHKEVLNVIENRARNNVVGVLMPVKTLGCVEFSEVRHFGESDEEIIFIRKPGIPFHYEGVDQSLRYALAFALSQHHKNRGFFDSLIDSIFGKDVVFRNALQQFANQRYKSFKMYGNTSLIL